MPNKKTSTSDDSMVQLPLPDFIEQLSRNPGIPLKRKVTASDIGGQLLSIISRGLYGNPLDFIREYAQNAVDGCASNVRIRITGRAVSIDDDGDGMTVEDLLEARKVGFSPKSLSNNVGFRGIGIYSSFDVCNRLFIATKKQGSIVENILEFDFESMRHHLELGEQSSLEQGVNLTDLITNYSTFTVELLPPDFSDRHYTRVYLDELDESHFRELITKPKKLHDYILRNLPIDFHKSFVHKDQITHLLRVNTEAYNPVVVQLEIEGQPAQEISRPAIPDLAAPKYGFIQNSQGDNVAFYWACLTNNRKVISEKDYGDYRGLTYKIKGFSIGDNRKLKEFFGRTGGGTLYDRYFGEIYVLDKNIRPNSARDDFEPSEAKTSLEAAVVKTLKQLHNDASREQQKGKADESIALAVEEIDRIEDKLESYSSNELLEVFRTIGNLIEDIEEKLSDATDRNKAQRTLDRAQQLQDRVSARIDNRTAPFVAPLPIKEDDSQEEQSAPNKQGSYTSNNQDTHTASLPPSIPDNQNIFDLPLFMGTPEGATDEPCQQEMQLNPNVTVENDDKNNEPDQPQQEYITLVSILADYGYEPNQDMVYILRVIDETLSEVLGYDSELYGEVLSEFDRRLSD